MKGNCFMFSNKIIEAQYAYWCASLINQKNSDYGYFTAFDVLTSHYLIAEFFSDQSNEISCIGPRDGNCDLLHQVVSRQYVEFLGGRKWNTNFEIIATLMYGLIKNNPFNGANKRTALLCALCLLEREGYVSDVEQKIWENLVVDIASGKYKNSILYEKFSRDQSIPGGDADIYYISNSLRAMTRGGKRGFYSVNYRQLGRLLENYDYKIEQIGRHDIAIYNSKNNQIMGNFRIYKMNDKVNEIQFKKIISLCHSINWNNIRNGEFFKDMNLMEFLLTDFNKTFINLSAR